MKIDLKQQIHDFHGNAIPLLINPKTGETRDMVLGDWLIGALSSPDKPNEAGTGDALKQDRLYRAGLVFQLTHALVKDGKADLDNKARSLCQRKVADVYGDNVYLYQQLDLVLEGKKQLRVVGEPSKDGGGDGGAP